MHIELDRTQKASLTRQVYEALKEKILSGELAAGQQLPPTRSLAVELSVSRNVVLYAYDQLTAEGYIESVSGSGTFVKPNLYLPSPAKGAVFAERELIGLRHEPQAGLIDFRTGVPDLSFFPIRKWGRLYQSICDSLNPETLDYYEPQGSYRLRKHLAAYLQRSRGVICRPEQMIITTGAAQAFTLTARMLLRASSTVVVEDPINCDILKIIQATGAHVIPVPVDQSGMQTDLLPDGAHPTLIFTTPSHQFPIGSILSAERRIALIRYAEKNGSYILEDDYDSDFRFVGLPIAAMQSLCPERVIYTGSFSKKLFPALRLGFIVLPESLTRRFAEIKHLEDLHSPVLEQLTLAAFIEQGLLEKYIHASKRLYQHRRKVMESALKNAFGDSVVILGNDTGIHLVAQFPGRVFSPDVYPRLAQNGVRVYPIDIHTIEPGLYRDMLMLGYGNLSDDMILEGVRRMRQVII